MCVGQRTVRDEDGDPLDFNFRGGHNDPFTQATGRTAHGRNDRRRMTDK